MGVFIVFGQWYICCTGSCGQYWGPYPVFLCSCFSYLDLGYLFTLPVLGCFFSCSFTFPATCILTWPGCRWSSGLHCPAVCLLSHIHQTTGHTGLRQSYSGGGHTFLLLKVQSPVQGGFVPPGLQGFHLFTLFLYGCVFFLALINSMSFLWLESGWAFDL